MNPMRHVLGVLGVLAAGVLLAVSAAMNWRFGFSLGRTELDGQIYGAASAAADCLKALIPFFFFAAVRNKIWSQAAAAAVVWVVVTSYSMTSALGHAALNRFDSRDHRAQAAQAYQDLRDDLKRAEQQLGWVPQHRPLDAVNSEIDRLKTQKGWQWTAGCTQVTSKTERSYCEQFHALGAEVAYASEAKALETRIADIRSKLQAKEGASASTESDPQARVLTELAAMVIPNVKIETVQMAMTIFVALLLEIGSGFGMYVAFSQWRLYDVKAPAAPEIRRAVQRTATAAVAAPVLTPLPAEASKPNSGANDNRTVEVPLDDLVASIEQQPERPALPRPATVAKAQAAPARKLVPESNTELFYKENIEIRDGSSVTTTELYEDYCSWCETRHKEPSALPSFAREFAGLGVKKEKIAGRVRFIGIALNSGTELAEAKKSPLYRADAA